MINSNAEKKRKRDSNNAIKQYVLEDIHTHQTYTVNKDELKTKISYVAHCADRRRRSGAQTSATEVERSRTGRRSVRAQWRTPPEGEVWV